MSGNICRYFNTPQGCRFGTSCRFVHPIGANATPFGAAAQQPRTPDSYIPATAENIKTDLHERPIWPLSSFGSGKNPPCQLIDGKDVSPEEARVMAYLAQAEGNPAAYAERWTMLTNEATIQIQNILNDLPGAVRYMEQSQQNRDQIYKYKTPGEQSPVASAPSPFGQPAQPQQTPNTFGTPAQPSQSAFGTPAFGQPAFGQPAFGQPAFGSSSALGTNAPSPFAAAASQNAQPAFGQPAFGQTSTPQSAFGKPAQPAFGQPAFGQTSMPQSTFGKPAQPAFGQPAFSQSSFGQPQQLQQQPTQPQGVFGSGGSFGAKPAFGQPAFGQPAFGATSTLGSNAPSPFATAASQAGPSPSPFAVVSQAGPSPSPFATAGQNQSQATPSPFSAFAQSQQQQTSAITPSPFGQPQQAQQSTAPSPFSQPNPFQQAQAAQPANASNLFGQPSAPQQPVSASPFGSTQPSTTSPFSNANPFQSAQQPSQAPVSSSFQTSAAQLSAAPKQDTTDKWDDPVIRYTEVEIQAFKAPRFTIGMIPLVAPPRELCSRG
ncbi:hypothetical protein FN846DRAFT_945946 [Sphaerosporella brunnea]|uniref:C3H1-type domain-containing protein n=1 Tax=Sphaerosporella brunnea TaxID=1250544 RepID=A0A5J5EZT3_9PEZI|nr:hypothetical protein FN846DRAFT_945946 [Sphaerosporella brunnea]